jgi:amino acid permease
MEQAPPRRASLGERMRYSVDQKTAPGNGGHPNYNADHEKGEGPVDGLDGKPLLARALQGRHMQMIAIGMEHRFPS